MRGTVHQVNVKPSTPGERGLPKRPVASALVTESGMQGDFNLWRHERRRDDPDLALLIIPLETLWELNAEGWPVRPGDMGENITTLGVPYTAFAPGKVFRAGDAEVRISKACDPCTNLYLLPYVGDARGPAFVKTMVGRRGWYGRVVTPGRVATGDAVEEMGTDVSSPASPP